MKILVLNSLDERYGSTYRIRAFRDRLAQAGFEMTYVEQPGNAVRKIFSAIFAAWGSYDLLLTQKFNPITLKAIGIARIRGKPVVVDWDDWDVGLQNNCIKRLIARCCEAIGPYFVSAITTHSEEIRAHALKFRPTELLPQGFDDQLFNPNGRDKIADRKRWGFNKDDKIVGHLCTFTHGGAMDLPMILKAWTDPALASMKFLLIGGGPLENKIRDEIATFGLSSRVTLTGLLPQTDIPAALNSLNAGVIYMSDSPANRARASFKVIEYLAMNVPVVGKVVGETAKRFERYVTPANADNLAVAIASVVASTAQKETAEAMKEYRWSQTIARLPDILHRTLKERDECN